MVPVNGASNVPVNADIVLTFSELIQEASLLPNFTLLRDGATVGVTGNLTFDGTVATFDPASNLDLFSSYPVTVGSGVLDVSGNPLEPTFTSTFVTSSTSP